MTTLPGLASKGEKGKSKYQSLDINSLYRSSRGESIETHQQKNTLPRKHGMQILGRVPNARRPPANLPSLKSEHSGSDAAVSLVPSGGPGWGKQDTPITSSTTITSSPATSIQTTTSVPTSITTVSTVTVHQAAIAIPATSPVVNKQPPVQSSSVAQPVATIDKSWSAIMAGADFLGHPPPYQSPQFQHEFPSLSAGDGVTAAVTQRNINDVQYGPGPSLRPQTEGSWMQGGSRSTSGTVQVAETGPGTAKVNSGQLVGPPQLLVPAGHGAILPPHQHLPPPQFRGLLPPFMCRGNFPPNGHGSNNFQTVTNPMTGRVRFPGPGGQVSQDGRGPTRTGPQSEVDDQAHRPIIKEEDLNRMDDMTRDVGWASHDDIDYNQKLAFSDDELPPDRERDRERERDHERERDRERDREFSQQNKEVNIQKKEPEKIDQTSAEIRSPPNQNRGWNAARPGSQPVTPQQGRNQSMRRVEEDEIWEQRRRQQSEEVAIAVERAKLRKEEEEKRYLETKQAAAKKLQELEDKIKEKKGVEIRENEEGQGTINPSTVPPQPITPVPIPVPEWERERETRERERSRTPNDTSDNKQHAQTHREADFRQLTQIEGRSFVTKNNSRSTEREISRDRDCRERDRDIRERDGPNFSRHFQSNLPPRFQKQQAERQNNVTTSFQRTGNSGSPQPQQTSVPILNVPFAQQYDPRWVQNNSTFPVKSPVGTSIRNNRKEDVGFEKNREEERGIREMRRDRHTPDTERDRPYSESGRRVSGEGHYYDDYRTYRRENSQEYEYKRERDDDKWEKERHYDDRKEDVKKSSQVQQDPFDAHDINRQDSGEWRREKYNKESSEERITERQREDTSQRPDSRDSRISKESLRDCSDYTGNWADSPFEPTFEDKKKEIYREERRIVPGPITKEKIEADDLKNEKRHLTQLKRSDIKSEKKIDDKLSDKKIDDAWVVKKKELISERNETDGSPKAWVDATSPITAAPEHKFLEALEKGNKKSESLHTVDSKQDNKKLDKDISESNKEKDDKHQGASRGRNDGGRSHRAGWGGGSYAVYHGSWSKRGEGRTSRGSQRSGHRPHSSRSGEWQHASDSEISGDEISVSTESGKEDRRYNQPQRSPKPLKKSDKDDKNKDMKQEKSTSSERDRKFEKRSYDQNSRSRESYVPRGEPSRHGRGGFRGSRSIISSKRIDGYGIPPSKSPFGNHDDKDKKLSGDEIGGEVISSDEKTKMNQQALSAGIIGSARNQNKNEALPRVQRKSDSEKRDRSRGRTHSGSRRQKPKPNKINSSDAGEENWETTSDNSDIESERKDKGRRKQIRNNQSSFPQNNSSRQNVVSSNINQNHRHVNSQVHRNVVDKRNTGFATGKSESQNSTVRQNSSTSLRTNQQSLNVKTGKENICKDDAKNDCNTFTAAIENVKALKDNKIERSDSVENTNVPEDINSDEKSFDTDGFQEVRSKKNVKERQKTEEKVTSRTCVKPEKEPMLRGQKFKGNSTAMQLTPQQIANIPPLLGTPVNPPNMLTTGNNKTTFERPRQNKLAPRFAKQRENRMQKAQMQGMCDVNEMNKINQNVSMYGIKDGSSSGPVPVVNAWDKPITSQLRNNVETENLLAMGVDNCVELEQAQQSTTSSQRSSPSNDKGLTKGSQVQDKALLDGATPPVNTIIFENTNYKSTPVNTNSDLAVKAKFSTHLKTQQRQDKGRGNKLEEPDMDNTVMPSFNKPITDMLNKSETKPEPIQMPLSFNKAEDSADMKLDFTFDSDLTQLTDDKSSKSLGLPRSMHVMTSAQSTISPSTADLNFKIASVKKVWETTMPTVLEHSVGPDDSVNNNSATFSSSFGPDPNALDHSTAFNKGTDQPDDNHEGYSPSANQSCTSNNTTNVCKVKPTQQLAGTGQAVHSVSSHHTSSQQHQGTTSQHSAMVGQNLIGHPLSPPPMQVLGAGVGLGQPPQQYASNQHINYQPSLGGSAQYGGMSAIPSPPTVLFNSTQQMPTQGGLYGPFQIDQSQVLNTQGRSQYSQYPNPYGLGQTASSPYSAQSMYLQTAPPHPPPSAQPPDIYQSLSSQYRMAATGPFGQSQQLTNNPSTVLISSTSNSLMSATVKPSTQQISAIGTKAGNVSQAYQQQSQQGQQLYIPYDPSLQANYLSSTGVLQRGPTGPVQNNVVPGLQPSSSYYSGSAGAQTGFYQQPGNSTLQSAQLHQHQTNFGLQGNVFGTHNQSHASAGLQSFGSQFLSSPMQMAAAAALTAQQQYRSPNLPNPNYLKGVSNQHMTDQSGRSQQLKSPGANQQDVLASVFNSAPQIPSPKSRQNCKQPPPQSSPTQHKYVSPYQTVNSQQSAQIPPTRYPTPIQRPVNFQPNLNNSLQGTGNVGQRHRPAHNQNSRGPQQRQYYGGQGGGIQSSQSDKSDESKLIENGSSGTITASNSSVINSSNGVTKSTIGNTSANQSSDLAKDTGSKDETISNKE